MDKENLIVLKEYTESKEVTPLTEYVENSDGKKTKELYIQGPFLEGGVLNRNGRIYPVEMLESAVKQFTETKMRGIGVPGELNHPQSSIQVDLDRVSHYITELKMEGNQGIGKAKIASTPKGELAKCLINDGLILGVSTRGVGKLYQNDKGENVVSDFELVTVDIVSDPSAPNAFVEAVMESLQYYKDEKTNDLKLATTIEDLLETIKGNLSVLPKKTELRDEKIFQNIMMVLNSL